ncbi:MAG: hydrogenase/urease maturation nickel metallochaperone HypA [Candidatus Berkiellales bacterium]
MHEHSLMNDLFKKIEEIANTLNAKAVTQVHIKLGALAHISPEHFREHFDEMRKNSVAEHAEVIITTDTNIDDPKAQDITLVSIEVPEE